MVRKFWSEHERKSVQEHFPYISASEMTKLLPDRTISAINHMAQKIGAGKSHERRREAGRENVSRRQDRQPGCFTEPPSPSC